MKIGIVVDGQGEVAALSRVTATLGQETGNIILRPVYAAIQPNASASVAANAACSRVRQLLARGADRVLVLVDREARAECATTLANALERELCQLEANKDIRVVIKDRTFENWVIADTAALAKQRARFTLTNTVRNEVAPNKADNVDAVRLLRRCVNGDAYDKVQDATRTFERVTLVDVAANSRSFRRFLRCVGHPAYLQQSKLP